ncbi:MAG: hypothetical protein V1747_03010 [Candidatus Omnitrophota bacterium]
MTNKKPYIKCFGIIFFLFIFSAMSYAAEIIFLDAASSESQTSGLNQFSFSQRLHDLTDFASYKQYGPDRSGMINGRVSTQVEFTNVSGNQTKSFYRDSNEDYQADLSLNIFEKLPNGYQLQSQSAVRKTDNSRVESSRDVKIKQFNISARNDDNLFELGDFYADFSQFVMGSSLEGANAQMKVSDLIELKTVAARKYASDSAAGLFQRDVAGLKTDTFLLEDSELFSLFRLGVQGVSVQDDSSTIPDNSSSLDLNNSVYGVDGEMRMQNGTSLLFELARGRYIKDEDVAAKEINSGLAFRVQPGFRYEDWFNLRYLYYYVQPEFYSEVGSASSDKIQHQMVVDLRLSEKNILSLTENLYWDHLDDSKLTKRTTNNDQYISLTTRPFEDNKDFSIRTYVNCLDKNSDDLPNSAESTTATYGLSLNTRISEAFLGVFFEHRYFDDKAAGAATESFQRFGSSFSRDFTVGKRRLYLAANYSVDARDTRNDENLSLSNGLSLTGRYEISDPLNFNFGYNLMVADNAEPLEDYYTNKTYGELSYKLKGERNGVITTRAELNNYLYDSDNGDYQEKRFVLKFASNF